MTTAAASPRPRRSAGSGRMEGFDLVTLRAGELEARFAPSLGMAGVSLRHAGEELLDRRAGLRAYRETGAVMGLPLLHPWANRLSGDEYELDGRRVRLPAGPPLVRRDDRGLPIHGLLAAHPGWSTAPVEVPRAGGQRLRARLDFGASPELMAAFPFAHELELDVTLSPQRLRVRTTVRATGRAPVPVAFGFHPYLRLPGADRREWELSLPSRLELGLDARGIPSGAARRRPAERLALGDRAFDDAFDGIADGAAFTVAGGGRAITVTHEHGYPVAQLFAPAGSPFVCLEPMTAPVDALRSGTGLRRVAPGGAFSACFSIAVRRS